MKDIRSQTNELLLVPKEDLKREDDEEEEDLAETCINVLENLQMCFIRRQKKDSHQLTDQVFVPFSFLFFVN